MSLRHTTIDPWGARLHLALNPDDLHRLNRRYALDQIDPGDMGATTLVLDRERHNGVHMLVYVNLAAGADLRTVVHESVHVGAMLLEHVGGTIHGESETLAYLVEWVAQWISEQVARECPELVPMED